MSGIDLQVSANDDDARELWNGTSFNSTHVAVWLWSSPVNSFSGGFRFQNVLVPQGATINVGTYWSVHITGLSYDSPRGLIAAEDVDSANNFTVEPDVITRWNTKRTSATVSWIGSNIGTGWKNSPDIATVIQEVIDRPGWVSGSDLVVLFAGDTTFWEKFEVSAHPGANPELAAKLHIEYDNPFLPPSDLVCSVVSSVQMHLSWQDNSPDEVGFKIERATSDTGPWDQIDTVGADVEEYDDIGLDPNKTYCYRVRAYK